MKRLRVLLLYGADADTATYSYQVGWPRHFMQHAGFACVPVNVRDRTLAGRVRAHVTVRRARVDAIVVLHSVFSNACVIGERLLDAVAARKLPTAYFIGNEYKLMPEKMRFCDRLGLALLVTMNPAPRAHALYRARLGCAVTTIPSAGLDTEIFRPVSDREDRAIDIGYRAADPPLYLGNTERRHIADAFVQRAPAAGFSVDISLDPADRFDEGQWAAFLNRCRNQLGTEAGGDFFELTDETRTAVNAYQRAHPTATADEIIGRFFPMERERIPVRTISGRHAEAAGTKTTQVLFEGDYSGYMEPNVHYIPLRKDLADLDDVFRKLRDDGHCRKIADNAYEMAIAELTYARLIDRFHTALAPLV
jgi:hypothetical protein